MTLAGAIPTYLQVLGVDIKYFKPSLPSIIATHSSGIYVHICKYEHKNIEKSNCVECWSSEIKDFF